MFIFKFPNVLYKKENIQKIAYAPEVCDWYINTDKT